MNILQPSCKRSRNLSIVSLLPSISLGIPDNILVLIYTPGWRQAPREQSLSLRPEPLDPVQRTEHESLHLLHQFIVVVYHFI